MVIDGDWKNKVRTMRANKNHEGAKRELRKAKMSIGYRNTTDRNKIFIDYCLAHYAFVENDFDLANMYLNSLDTLFNDNDFKITDYQKEYCNYLWLYVNINYTNIEIDIIVSSMKKVYDYYISIEENDIAISALVNIFRFQGDEERILEGLSSLMKCDNISDWNFVDSILSDCDKISHNLYIKALEIVDEYNIHFNIDIV